MAAPQQRLGLPGARRRPPRGCRGAVGACLPGAGDRRPASSTWSALDPDGVLVGVEVKLRRSARAGDPVEALDGVGWSGCEGRWPTMPRSGAQPARACGSTW